MRVKYQKMHRQTGTDKEEPCCPSFGLALSFMIDVER
jgi:hypothetical protein